MVEATNQSQGESKELRDEEEQEAENHEEDGEEEEEEEEDDFLNNHDLIGVQGIIRAQKNEIDKKKVRKDIAFGNRLFVIA